MNLYYVSYTPTANVNKHSDTLGDRTDERHGLYRKGGDVRVVELHGPLHQHIFLSSIFLSFHIVQFGITDIVYELLMLCIKAAKATLHWEEDVAEKSACLAGGKNGRKT